MLVQHKIHPHYTVHVFFGLWERQIRWLSFQEGGGQVVFSGNQMAYLNVHMLIYFGMFVMCVVSLG